MAVPSLLCIIILRFILSSSEDIHASYMGNVTLTANHNKPAPFFVRWYINDKYSGGDKVIVVHQFRSSDPVHEGNFTADRVALDFETGTLHISELGCWEDQVYICQVAAPAQETIISHNLILGKK